MSDPVAVAVISTIGSVLVALFGLLAHQLKGIKRDASEAKVQVKNSHKTNLRDDMDLIHKEVVAIRQERRDDHEDVISMKQDIRYLTSTDRRQWEAIDALQNAQNRSADA